LARYWRHTPVYEALLEQDGIFLRHNPQPAEPATEVSSEVMADRE
jgi:hypothetical protein